MATAKYKKNERGEYTARVWDGTYNRDGSKHRKKLTSKKSSADLERIVADFKDKVNNREVSVYSGQTFTEYAYEWLSISKSAKEQNTRAMYANVIKVHLSDYDNLLLVEFTHSHFQQAINLQLDHPRTCQQIYITVKQIIKSAVRDHILPKSAIDDICDDISLPKYTKSDKRPLTALEKEAFFNARLDDRKLAFVSILYYCGLRRGEALALSPSDFDWTKNEVRVRNVIVFDKNNGTPTVKPYPKSNNGIRTVPIPDAGIAKIKPFVDGNNDPYLFHGQNSDLMTLTAFIRMWQSIIASMNAACGYNANAKKDRQEKPITGLTPHIFRHNFCTSLCYEIPKISTKMIARLLGDSERMVLEVYSHIKEDQEDLTGSLNSAFTE